MNMVARGSSVVVASASPALPANHNPTVSNKTVKIVTHRRFNLEAMREAYRVACKDAIDVAFHKTSRHATCIEGHRLTGIGPHIFFRILNDETKTPNAVEMGAVAYYYSKATNGRVCPAMVLLNQMAGLI